MKGNNLATLPRPIRSIAQCRYLNSVAYKMLSDHLGYEPWEIRNMVCKLYFGGHCIRRNGDIWHVPDRTTTIDYDGSYAPLEPREFGEFVEFVQRFGAKHGVVIPDPEKQK